MTSRTGRLAPHIRATALILLLLMALSPGRLHYNQTTESIDSDTVLRPTDGLGGNRPSAVALDPTTGALYVGFLHTPNIIRITQPNIGVGDPKVVIGNSQDNKETAGLAFLSVAGVESLIELDASGVGQIPNPAASSSKCIASSLGQLGTRLVASLGTRVDVDAFIALKLSRTCTSGLPAR
ncbi:MAG: hypothetical protein E6I75_25830 [Chloroflexi bacterium]|nr:MAG: hypothetical protein E6I75_25830 [Chloroflexota bacterium]